MTDSKGRSRVYIAGPYTGGKWGTNIRNAVEEAEHVAKAGHVPFIPHTMTALWSILYEKSGQEWLNQDFSWIETCDALIRIPGDSPGAEEEVELAKELGIPVYNSAKEFVDDQKTTIPQ